MQCLILVFVALTGFYLEVEATSQPMLPPNLGLERAKAKFDEWFMEAKNRTTQMLDYEFYGKYYAKGSAENISYCIRPDLYPKDGITGIEAIPFITSTAISFLPNSRFNPNWFHDWAKEVEDGYQFHHFIQTSMSIDVFLSTKMNKALLITSQWVDSARRYY